MGPSFVLALAGIAAATLAPSCSCDDEADGETTTTTGSNSPGSGGFGAGGDESTSTGFVGCDPECVAPQFCSVENQCIDEGTCLGDEDCEQEGFECNTETNLCEPGGKCGGLEAQIESVPPNLLIVLDRSCSMTTVVNGTGGLTKWDISVAALDTLTTNYAGDIWFGLSLFPDTVTPSCAQDVIAIPPASGTETAIQTLLTSALVASDPNFPDGPCVTNIDTAMEQAAAEPAFLDTTRDSFAVLITDGKQAGCSLAGGDAGTETIIGNMFAAGVPTFVIGFGSGIDPVQMDLFANAGGVPNTGPAYYDASDQASLDAALDIIASATISCSFTLDETPPDPEEIYVFFDNLPVDEDGTNGWTYDEATNTITFNGPACDDLQSGSVTDVDVVFGCDEPTPD
jgi:hypothetical protein